MTDFERLIDQLRMLSHGQRMAHMVEVGRHAAGDGADAARLRSALQQMEAGGPYQRRLALQACHGSRDGDHVLRAVVDPSAHVSGFALKLTAVVCDDRQVLAAIEAIQPGDRAALLVRLLHRDRRSAIDAYLDQSAARGWTTALARLLPFGSHDCAARHLRSFAGAADLDAWRRLARQHPDLAADAITGTLSARGDKVDLRVIRQATTVLSEIVDQRPDRALDIFRLLARQCALDGLPLESLLRRRPNETVDLVIHSEGGAGVSFAPVVGRLDPSKLRMLLEQSPRSLPMPQEWLRRLPPALRGELFASFGDGWAGKGGVVPLPILMLLPRQLREQEGRRHLALPALSARPADRLPYASLLPWDDAVAELKASAASPDPERRAVAIAAVVATGRFHRDRLGDVLAFVAARKNEQDPVRLAAMTALSSLPPGCWKTEHLDALGLVIRQALDAADLSNATATAAEQLAVKLLPHHPAWSAGWIATLVRERGRINLYGLEHRLSDDDVRRAAPALVPVFESWETRERRPQLLAAAQALGRRLTVVDGLADMLENMLYERIESWTAAQALGTLKQHCPERFRRLVPALLSEDASWATQPVVYHYLHTRAQDLLTPFLGRHAYTGRFSTGRTRFVLPVRDGFFRWTPQQQAAFAATLDELSRDSVRDTPTLLAAIDQMSALPDVEPKRLFQLAHADNKKLAVRDAALRALGRLDGGRGVAALLEALQDDRARIAIYALRAALRKMPSAGALALLRRVPTDKVTVAKEVVRLLGDLRTDDAFADLTAMADRGAELHRDVRVALLRAFWEYLERPQAWQRLHQAAVDPDPDIADGVVRVPADGLNAGGHRELASLLATLLGHADPKLRLDVLQRVRTLPISDDQQKLMPPLLRAMGSDVPDISRAAADAVFATYAGREARLVAESIATLIPNRHALRTAVSALILRAMKERTHLLPTSRAVVAVLAGDPLMASLRAQLAMLALPPSELRSVLESMARDGSLHAGAVATAVVATGAGGLWPVNRQWDRIAEVLFDHPDERVRRIGLAALTAAAESGHGWNDRRRQRLAAMQADPSPLVAGAAQFTFPDDSAGNSDVMAAVGMLPGYED